MSPTRRQLLLGIAATPALAAFPAPPPVAALAASPGDWVNGTASWTLLSSNVQFCRCYECMALAGYFGNADAAFALAKLGE